MQIVEFLSILLIKLEVNSMYGLKCFSIGVFVGIFIIMIIGYLLLLIDKRKDEENAKKKRDRTVKEDNKK